MELYHREAISKIQNEGNSIGQKKLGFIKNKLQEKEEGAIYWLKYLKRHTNQTQRVDLEPNSNKLLKS